MRKFVFGLAALSLLAGSVPAFAAPCKDAKGKFIKCPPVKAKPKACRNAKGHFAKCK
jgi:hypothetical protein